MLTNDDDETAAELTDETIVREPGDRPRQGWRRGVYVASQGLLNPGPSSAEQIRRGLLHRIRRPLSGSYRIAVSSMKGGVGKTTVAACLGLALAENRGDRIVAVDADPDAGTLADRLTGDVAVTVRQMLDDLATIRSWTDISRYTSLMGRLQVLASEQDPAMSEPFNGTEYELACETLARFHNVIVTDSGTGLMHGAMEGILALSDAMIVVGTPTVDGASRASRTLDWLLAHGHRDLADDAVVVLTGDRTSPAVDADAVREHFGARCRAVVDIPNDPHLATGGRVDLARLRTATLDAFLQLAALVADRFSSTVEHRGAPLPLSSTVAAGQ